MIIHDMYMYVTNTTFILWLQTAACVRRKRRPTSTAPSVSVLATPCPALYEALVAASSRPHQSRTCAQCASRQHSAAGAVPPSCDRLELRCRLRLRWLTSSAIRPSLWLSNRTAVQFKTKLYPRNTKTN